MLLNFSEMGLTYANILIQNGDDAADFRRHRIGEDEIRQMDIHALVDTGSVSMGYQRVYSSSIGIRNNWTSSFAIGRRNAA